MSADKNPSFMRSIGRKKLALHDVLTMPGIVQLFFRWINSPVIKNIKMHNLEFVSIEKYMWSSFFIVKVVLPAVVPASPLVALLRSWTGVKHVSKYIYIYYVQRWRDYIYMGFELEVDECDWITCVNFCSLSLRGVKLLRPLPFRLCMFVHMHIPNQTESLVFVARRSVRGLLCPFLVHCLRALSRVPRAQQPWIGS